MDILGSLLNSRAAADAAEKARRSEDRMELAFDRIIGLERFLAGVERRFDSHGRDIDAMEARVKGLEKVLADRAPDACVKSMADDRPPVSASFARRRTITRLVAGAYVHADEYRNLAKLGVPEAEAILHGNLTKRGWYGIIIDGPRVFAFLNGQRWEL